MEKEILKQKIRELIWDYVLNEFESTCKKIIPKKEIIYLPIDKTPKSIYTYIFIIERYLNNKIIPIEYNIKYSKSYSELNLNDVHKKSIATIKKLLENGDASINSYSKGFIPNSIKNYFKQKGDSYSVDFSGSIWGIKHLHLNPNAKDDTLLFYVIIDNTIYFLKIGEHSNLFSKTILETIINDFPEILSNLGIAPMPDMPMPEKQHNYLIEDVKHIWESGGNVSYTINNKYYTSVNLQSTSSLPAKYNYFVSNISYQIEHHIELFLKEIIKDENYQDIDVRIINNKDLLVGKRLLAEEISKSAILLNITYLENIDYAEMIKTMNFEK